MRRIVIESVPMGQLGTTLTMRCGIVGAGLAGLTAARVLQQSGCDATLFEKAEHLGGRLHTTLHEGFGLDAGFQVFFDAYPTLRQFLGAKLDQCPAFEPGALLWDGSRLHEFNRNKLLAAALMPLFPLRDKLRLQSLGGHLKASTHDEFFSQKDQSIESFLREYGFSTAVIDHFFRPFLGGIFLDRTLKGSAAMFKFVWKCLEAGSTRMPAGGIQQLGEWLAEPLDQKSILLGAGVAQVRSSGSSASVQLHDGTQFDFDAVIVACDGPESNRLLDLPAPCQSPKKTTCVYFACAQPPVTQPLLVLNATERGVVNEVVPVSVVAPQLAPAGQHLVSASLLTLDDRSDEVIGQEVQKELANWFPQADVASWKLVGVQRVPYAQMQQEVGFAQNRPKPHVRNRLFMAGEALVHSSIEGAMRSGQLAAEAVLRA